MIYPYYETNWDQPENRDVIRRSCQYWSDLGVRNTWSQAVMSSMQSSVGNGDGALLHMERALNTRHLGRNTMHFEAERRVFPCSETHGGMCQMLQDMLIQSWGDKIRVFPATADAWPDVIFHNLRAEGAFLVSASRKDGKTQWVRVRSLAGEPCKVAAKLEAPVRVAGNTTFTLTALDHGVFEISLERGDEAVLYTGDEAPDLEVVPLAAQQDQTNVFGLK
jgi:hypothetical protein